MSKCHKISVECRLGFMQHQNCTLSKYFHLQLTSLTISVYMPVDHEAMLHLCDYYNSDHPLVTSQSMVPYTFGHALITLQAMLPCSLYNSSHAPVTLPCSQLHFSTPISSFLAVLSRSTLPRSICALSVGRKTNGYARPTRRKEPLTK